MNRFYHVSPEKTTLFNKKFPRCEKGAEHIRWEAKL